METVMNLNSLLNFITASAGNAHAKAETDEVSSTGFTQAEIAEHFGSSTRTVQRWLEALTDARVDLRVGWRGRQKVYRVYPRSAFDRPSFRNSRVKTLRVAEFCIMARVMDGCGWAAAARWHRAHANNLLAGEAQARRKEIEEQVARLLERVECSPSFGADPVPWSYVIDCLHMAILAERQVLIDMPGKQLIGLIGRVVYCGGDGEVWLQDGQKTDLGSVQKVLGVSDLEESILMAA
jgi:hypothetical protein